jgi:hypothetical protein
VTLVMLAGRRFPLSQVAVFISGFVASVLFPARAWLWALLIAAAPLLLTETIAPALPAMLLLLGTVSGSLIVAYSRGMIAAERRGKRRMLVAVVLAAAISFLLARLVFQLIRR